jgi:hypothetical protein
MNEESMSSLLVAQALLSYEAIYKENARHMLIQNQASQESEDKKFRQIKQAHRQSYASLLIY